MHKTFLGVASARDSTLEISLAETKLERCPDCQLGGLACQLGGLAQLHTHKLGGLDCQLGEFAQLHTHRIEF
jgi:hypothetical protein